MWKIKGRSLGPKSLGPKGSLKFYNVCTAYSMSMSVVYAVRFGGTLKGRCYNSLVLNQWIWYSSRLSKSRIFHRTFWIIEPKSIKHLRPILKWFRRFSSTGGALTIKRTLLRIVRFWDFRKKVLELRIQLFTMEMFQTIKVEFDELNWTLYSNAQYTKSEMQLPNLQVPYVDLIGHPC